MDCHLETDINNMDDDPTLLMNHHKDTREHELVDSFSFTHRELNTCVHVLEAVFRACNAQPVAYGPEPEFPSPGDIPDSCPLFRSRECRALRQSLGRLTDILERRKFDGLGKHAYRQRKQTQVEVNGKSSRKKSLDQKYLNTTTLRRKRLEHLEELQQSSGGDYGVLPLIADGVALEEDTPPHLLLEGTSSGSYD